MIISPVEILLITFFPVNYSRPIYLIVISDDFSILILIVSLSPGLTPILIVQSVSNVCLYYAVKVNIISQEP